MIATGDSLAEIAAASGLVEGLSELVQPVKIKPDNDMPIRAEPLSKPLVIDSIREHPLNANVWKLNLRH